METIIKKAIEGGYGGENVMLDGSIVNENSFSSRGVRHPADIVCDPLFWQALSKSCGWGDIPQDGFRGRPMIPMEISYAMVFHEINLTEGWDKAVAYLLTQVPTRGTALVN